MASRRVKTPIFQGSYLHLLEPQEKTNDEGVKNYIYSVTMIFDPSVKDDPLFQDMKNIVVETQKEKWPNGLPKTGVRSPFRRGEWKSQQYPQGFDLDKYPEYTDKIIVVATSYTSMLADGSIDVSRQPGIVMPNGKLFPGKGPTPADIYSGVFARAEISAFVPKNAKSGPGVSFGIHHFQKCYDGKPLGISNGNPEEAFEEFVPPAGVGNHADMMYEDDLLGV